MMAAAISRRRWKLDSSKAPLGGQGTAAAIAGSDDANGDSGHGSDEGWKGQGTAAEAGGGSRTGLRARLGGGNVRWLFG